MRAALAVACVLWTATGFVAVGFAVRAVRTLEPNDIAFRGVGPAAVAPLLTAPLILDVMVRGAHSLVGASAGTAYSYGLVVAAMSSVFIGPMAVVSSALLAPPGRTAAAANRARMLLIGNWLVGLAVALYLASAT